MFLSLKSLLKVQQHRLKRNKVNLHVYQFLRKTLTQKKQKLNKNKTSLAKQVFFQQNLNSRCKHVTDNKLQVYYRQCHLPCLRSFHRLSIHFENHIHLSLLSIYTSIIWSSPL